MKNTKEINPKDFLSKLIVETNKIDFSIYQKRTVYTKHIFEKIIEILRKCNIPFNKEYYKVDTYGWEQQYDNPTYLELRNETENLNLKFHFWSPVVAIEHENEQKDWTDELIKLAYIRCPLKIIIGYTPFQSPRDDTKKLDVALKILQNMLYSKEDKDGYLLIFGISDKDEEYYSKQLIDTNNKYQYKGYFYKKGQEKFIEI